MAGTLYDEGWRAIHPAYTALGEGEVVGLIQTNRGGGGAHSTWAWVGVRTHRCTPLGVIRRTYLPGEAVALQEVGQLEVRPDSA